MIDRAKVLKGLECMANDDATCTSDCPYFTKHEYDCVGKMARDALELLKEQSAIIDALVKVGYPHNFQREAPWIVNYMLNITDVVRKAIDLKNREEVEQGG